MKENNSKYIPEFDKSFRHPRYWGVWLGATAMTGTALTSPESRDPTPARLGRFAGRLGKGSRRHALVNLSLCPPERSGAEYEAIADRTFAAAPQTMAMTVELTIRGPGKTQLHVDWQGLEIIEEMRCNNEKVIFLVPHSQAVNIPAMLVASQGQRVATMFHNQSNPVLDYVQNTVRRHFGGRLHARNDGIKPFIQSVRQGYWEYYLLDQDHGPEHSKSVDFFATYKATPPAIGRLMRVCRACAVPLFPIYDGKTHRLTIQVHPSVNDLSEVDDHMIVRRMNEEVEIFAGP